MAAVILSNFVFAPDPTQGKYRLLQARPEQPTVRHPPPE